MTRVGDIARRLDARQRRTPPLAFVWAVVRKYGEDGCPQLAAMIAYYAFFSIIPLLMVAVTVVGIVASQDPGIRERLLGAALHDLPVLGPQVALNVHAPSGGLLVLMIGVTLALWSGLGVVKAFASAMDAVWNVPERRRPGSWRSTTRALALLMIFGALLAGSTLLAGSASGRGWPWQLVAIALAYGVELILFAAAFRLLPATRVTWSDVWPGAALGAAAWTTLTTFGGFYVDRQLRHASEVYGTFAAVIVLLAWVYLGAQIALFAAELNVVRRERLFPRSLAAPSTGADGRATRRRISERVPTDPTYSATRDG